MHKPWTALLLKAALVSLGLAGGSGSVEAQITMPGMSVAWHHGESSVEFVVEAETTGWVALGFNTTDNIVGADLIMIRVVNGIAEAHDRVVVSAGNHRPVEERGGVSIVTNVDGQLVNGQISVRVRLSYEPATTRRSELTQGTELYLIAAYSVSPDLDHHSRLRRHFRVTL